MAGALGALEALQGVLHLLDRVRSDRSGLGPEERLEIVEAARLASRRLKALTAVVVAEADAAESSMVARGTPMTSWLALDAATDAKQAAGMVWTGKELGELPVVREAALQGGCRRGRAG
ncbi:hypothetical protein CGZ93_04630 [Enemella dayhoffiae]|uniref:Uncharacterized protein n=1 Tax=Enemella dayhoffiae TaxID=2016507 RepID=A0A255H8Q5_9ACTN|nr:hypothetical protein CGZ93_04630 [Enemella dayhoffiae]